MKKILLMVAGVILSAPFFVSAQSAPSTDQFTSAQTACIDLQYNMSYRSRDAKTNGEVSALQDFLNTQGYLETEPSGYFGAMTVSAVKSFQLAVGLGKAGTPGYGGVGPKTRAYIKNITCENTTTSTTPPQISLASNTKLGKYLGYLGGVLVTTIDNVTKQYAIDDCILDHNNNSSREIRCTWNGVEVYSFVPTLLPLYTFNGYPSTFTLKDGQSAQSADHKITIVLNSHDPSVGSANLTVKDTRNSVQVNLSQGNPHQVTMDEEIVITPYVYNIATQGVQLTVEKYPTVDAVAPASVPTTPVATSGTPTASITVNNLHDVTVKVGDTVNFKFNSTNGTKWTDSMTLTTCTNTHMNINSSEAGKAIDNTTDTISSYYAGCTIAYTYKVDGPGGSASDTSYIRVSPQVAAPSVVITETYAAGVRPTNPVFDQSTNSVWVANLNSDTVTKLNAHTGALVGTYSTGREPNQIILDSIQNAILVGNQLSSDITKLNSSTGATLGTYSAGQSTNAYSAAGITFDPSSDSIWVSLNSYGRIAKLSASTGALIKIYDVGLASGHIIFDPFTKSIWLANYDHGTVTKFNSVTGTIIGSYAVGTLPNALAFDQSTNSIWVANLDSNNVTKLNASNGAVLGTYAVGSGPNGVTFDPTGNSLWVSNGYSNSVTKLNASTGALINTYDVGTRPSGITFDSLNNSVWVATPDSNSVTRINAL